MCVRVCMARRGKEEEGGVGRVALKKRAEVRHVRVGDDEVTWALVQSA